MASPEEHWLGPRHHQPRRLQRRQHRAAAAAADTTTTAAARTRATAPAAATTPAAQATVSPAAAQSNVRGGVPATPATPATAAGAGAASVSPVSVVDVGGGQKITITLGAAALSSTGTRPFATAPPTINSGRQAAASTVTPSDAAGLSFAAEAASGSVAPSGILPAATASDTVIPRIVNPNGAPPHLSTVGFIAVIASAGVVGLAILSMLIYCLVKKRRERKEEQGWWRIGGPPDGAGSLVKGQKRGEEEDEKKKSPGFARSNTDYFGTTATSEKNDFRPGAISPFVGDDGSPPQQFSNLPSQQPPRSPIPTSPVDPSNAYNHSAYQLAGQDDQMPAKALPLRPPRPSEVRTPTPTSARAELFAPIPSPRPPPGSSQNAAYATFNQPQPPQPSASSYPPMARGIQAHSPSDPRPLPGSPVLSSESGYGDSRRDRFGGTDSLTTDGTGGGGDSEGVPLSFAAASIAGAGRDEKHERTGVNGGMRDVNGQMNSRKKDTIIGFAEAYGDDDEADELPTPQRHHVSPAPTPSEYPFPKIIATEPQPQSSSYPSQLPPSLQSGPGKKRTDPGLRLNIADSNKAIGGPINPNVPAQRQQQLLQQPQPQPNGVRPDSRPLKELEDILDSFAYRNAKASQNQTPISQRTIVAETPGSDYTIGHDSRSFSSEDGKAEDLVTKPGPNDLRGYLSPASDLGPVATRTYGTSAANRQDIELTGKSISIYSSAGDIGGFGSLPASPTKPEFLNGTAAATASNAAAVPGFVTSTYSAVTSQSNQGQATTTRTATGRQPVKSILKTAGPVGTPGQRVYNNPPMIVRSDSRLSGEYLGGGGRRGGGDGGSIRSSGGQSEDDAGRDHGGGHAQNVQLVRKVSITQAPRSPVLLQREESIRQERERRFRGSSDSQAGGMDMSSPQSDHEGSFASIGNSMLLDHEGSSAIVEDLDMDHYQNAQPSGRLPPTSSSNHLMMSTSNNMSTSSLLHPPPNRSQSSLNSYQTAPSVSPSLQQSDEWQPLGSMNLAVSQPDYRSPTMSLYGLYDEMDLPPEIRGLSDQDPRKSVAIRRLTGQLS